MSQVPCQSCGFANTPTAKFCGKCGAAMAHPSASTTISCPKCGSQNSPTAKFCGKCGEKMGAMEAQLPAQHVAAVAPIVQSKPSEGWVQETTGLQMFAVPPKKSDDEIKKLNESKII